MNKNDKKYFKEMIEDNDLFHVSIPMTVLGGLQRRRDQRPKSYDPPFQYR